MPPRTGLLACLIVAGCGNGTIAPRPIADFRQQAPETSVVAITSDFPMRLSAISAKPQDAPLHCTTAVTGTFGPTPGTGYITRPVALSGITPPVIKYVPPETWFAVIPPGTYYFNWMDPTGWPKGFVRSTFSIAAGERLYLGSYLFVQGRVPAPPAVVAQTLATYGFTSPPSVQKYSFLAGPAGCPYRGPIFVF